VLKEREIDLTLKYFGIERYNKLLPVASGTANQNYIIKDCKRAHKTAIEDLVLRKRSHKYSSVLQIRFEEEYLRHVYSKGVPVPVPLKDKNGDCWFNLDKGTYQLYPYISGRDFVCKNSSDVLQGGAFLGKLHLAVKDFVPKNERILPRYDDPSVILDVIYKTVAQNTFEITKEEKGVLDYVIRQAIFIKKKMPDLKYNLLPKLVIHGDYHPANVKYEKEEICGLFDFDWISRQPRIRDVADGIIFFSSKRKENIRGNDIFSLTSGYVMDMERARIFIKAYEKNVNIPLTSEENQYLLYFILARLIHSRVQALQKIPLNRSVEMLTLGMEVILKWVNENWCKI
jgi:Ser/Thr protein kinase RdoA (MazF antagonist)